MPKDQIDTKVAKAKQVLAGAKAAFPSQTPNVGDELAAKAKAASNSPSVGDELAAKAEFASRKHAGPGIEVHGSPRSTGSYNVQPDPAKN
jgi:hypothetical protein